MDRQLFEIQLIEYLEGELEGADLSEFQAALKSNPEWQQEVDAFAKLRHLYREQFPRVEAPAGLAERALARLPEPESRRWAFFGMGAFWRPLMTGAFVLAFTLVGVYEYKRWRDTSLPVVASVPGPVAVVEEPENFATAPTPAGLGEFTEPRFNPGRTRPYRSAWRPDSNPSLAGGGQVSLVSLGHNSTFEGDMGANPDIYRLEQEAQTGLAQFIHQQALRMNAMGDHQGAAEVIAGLVKKYPNYPRIFEAMALRIGCLFQLGQIQKAEQELTWLRQNSPGLAELVEQRWKGTTTVKNTGQSEVL